MPLRRSVNLPRGSELLDLEVHPAAPYAVAVVRRGRGTEMISWNFKGPAKRIAGKALEGRSVREIAFSPFGLGLYVLSKGSGDWRIDRFGLSGRRLKESNTIYASPKPLKNLVVPFLRYDRSERLFFGRQVRPKHFQILSVRYDGSGLYEVSSSSGKARLGHGRWAKKPPAVLEAASALPIDLHPRTGTLVWRSEAKLLHERPYKTNWVRGHPVAGVEPNATLRYSPNGHYRVTWVPGQPGAQLIDPGGRGIAVIAKGSKLVHVPVFAPSGRTVIVAKRRPEGARLEVQPIEAPLAPVRYLPDLALEKDAIATLGRAGILLRRGRGDQIYSPYERLRYDSCHRYVQVPVFASIDGFLEVLQAGFQAVFMRTELRLSRPRLAAFLEAILKVSKNRGLGRIERIAVVALRILRGDYEHPEGKRILAERSARSSLHTAGRASAVDFADFRPRGPYAGSEKLKAYFRAFKYINLLRLTERERRALVGESAVATAWRRWARTQAPFLSRSRGAVLFDPKARPPPHVRRSCIPATVRSAPPKVFPLSWGIDSEILESTVQRAGVAPNCTVEGRLLPTGLDLLSGLGSPEAASIQRGSDYRKYPKLERVHAALKKRFGKWLGHETLPVAWLGLVQRLTRTEDVPEGVSPRIWRRRLLQTALASWTSFRHTTVLVNEVGAAECGDDFDGFEELSIEPVRGAVDPLPSAWLQLAKTLDLLARRAKQSVAIKRIAKVIGQAAETARAFGAMARNQRKGIPLSEAQYRRIQRFAGEVEHPYKLLKTALKITESGSFYPSTVRPEPMTKIVDIHRAGPSILHAAVGKPLAVVVLLGDRGVLVPASGAVYSYYEVVATRPLDDAAWRERLDTAKPPPWAPEAAPAR